MPKKPECSIKLLNNFTELRNKNNTQVCTYQMWPS